MVATLAVPFIACNLIYSWKEFGGGSRPGTEFQSHFRLSEMKIQAGGWPFVYHRHFELHGATFTYQSWMMLIANVLLAIIFLVLVGLYVDRRRGPKRKCDFKLPCGMVLFATLVLSPLLFAWTSERYAQKPRIRSCRSGSVQHRSYSDTSHSNLDARLDDSLLSHSVDAN